MASKTKKTITTGTDPTPKTNERPGDLSPFLQLEVPEPGLDVAIHGSMDTDVPEPRLHVTIYGTVDLDVSKPGVDVALYTSLDQHIAPSSGDLLDALPLLDDPISHNPLFGRVSEVGREEEVRRNERADQEETYGRSHASRARRPLFFTKTTVRAMSTSARAPRISARRMVGPAAAKTARVTSVEPTISPQHALRMLIARITGSVPLSSRETSAATRSTPASKPQRTRAPRERVGSAIATLWHTDRLCILEKSREHKKVLRSRSRSYSSRHPGQEARCSRTSRSCSMFRAPSASSKTFSGSQPQSKEVFVPPDVLIRSRPSLRAFRRACSWHGRAGSLRPGP